MPELLTTSVTKDQLDNGTLTQNYVLCHQFYESEGMRTKSGIIVGVLTDLTYQEHDNPDDKSSHVADFAEVALKVYKCPEKLFFDPKDERSMEWETDMELEVGDIVFTNPIETLNAITLECEGELFKLIPYSDIYVAKRKQSVIPLNGYVLLSEVHHKATSALDVTTANKVDPTRGCVVYVGKANKRYRHPDYVDIQDLKEGDIVLFDRKAYPFRLERTSYNNFFSDTGEIFLVAQRRMINMIIDRK
jgi:co-chaperonin GroES (HSP10)